MTFEHLYLRFFFALHGQMVVCDIPTFEQIKANTYIFKPTTEIAEFLGKQLLHFHIIHLNLLYFCLSTTIELVLVISLFVLKIPHLMFLKNETAILVFIGNGMN